MSTKNLSRTVIEGGRVTSNKFERRESIHQERTDTRAFLKRVALAGDDFDIAVAAPKRKKVEKVFDDKLRPMERWLESQVNRPWRLVYAELLEKFDTRTTAGRHIVFDHLLPSIVGIGARESAMAFNHARYLVKDGLLIRNKIYQRYSRYSNSASWGLYYELKPKILEWLAGNEVRQYENSARLFWLVPTGWHWIHCPGQHFCDKKHFKHKMERRVDGAMIYPKHYVPVSLRQGAPFTDEHLAQWRAWEKQLGDLMKEFLFQPKVRKSPYMNRRDGENLGGRHRNLA